MYSKCSAFVAANKKEKTAFIINETFNFIIISIITSFLKMNISHAKANVIVILLF